MTRPRNRSRRTTSEVTRLAVGFSRLPRGAQLFIGTVLLIAAVVAGVMYIRGDLRQLSGPTSQPPVSRPAPDLNSPHLLLGNPGSAVADPARRDNYLIVRPAYALSWNDSLGTANWVSWRIVRSDFGQSPREVNFPPDPLLPPGFKQIGHRDYTGSGFDRGHLCPKGDRGGDREQSASTFYTTNIVPQAASLNQRAWNHLENYTRDLVGKHRQRVYVVAGPAGRGGTGLNGFKQTIGDGKITVPADCWKVIVAIPDSGHAVDVPSAIGSSARVIAVIMPNHQSKAGDDWAGFRTTPAEVENRTGLRLFDRLDPNVADALRQKLDRETIPPPSMTKQGY